MIAAVILAADRPIGARRDRWTGGGTLT